MIHFVEPKFFTYIICKILLLCFLFPLIIQKMWNLISFLAKLLIRGLIGLNNNRSNILFNRFNVFTRDLPLNLSIDFMIRKLIQIIFITVIVYIFIITHNTNHWQIFMHFFQCFYIYLLVIYNFLLQFMFLYHVLYYFTWFVNLLRCIL